MASEKFDAGKVIIEHVSNTSLDHPLIHLPHLGPIDMSVTKHVLMLWIVAAVVLLVVHRHGPALSGAAADGAVRADEPARGAGRVRARHHGGAQRRPEMGDDVWTPLILTLFVFILAANAIGLIPVFEVVGLLESVRCCTPITSRS